MDSIDSLSIISDHDKNEVITSHLPNSFPNDNEDIDHDYFIVEPPAIKIDTDVSSANAPDHHCFDSDPDLRNRFSSYSPEFGLQYPYVDTSFDDLAMAVEANSPDFMGGKQFNFDPPAPSSSNGKVRLRWTEEMDRLLLEGVKVYAEFGIGMWKRVAEYVQKHLKEPIRDESGNIISSRIGNHQCGERYKHHLDPSIKKRKSGPWSEEEIVLLHELVAKHQTVAEGYTQSGRTKSHINWIKISNELDRNYRDCQHKWATVSKAALKAGTYSKEEEEYIIRRVEEIGIREPGVWNTLEEELGRRARSIQDKYNRLMKKRKYLQDDIPIL